MKKVLVGISALLVATGVAFADGCTSGGKKCGCKPKKYRIVYVTAHNPDTMYDNSMFETKEIGPDYRMVPMESDAAMYERRVSYADDDRYYDHRDEDEEAPVPRNRKSSSAKMEGAYVGARLGVDLLTWKNKYKASPASAVDDFDADHDDYFLKPVFGGDVFAGLYVNPAIRADLEIGYMGKFDDSDNGFTFKLDSQYITLNGYYDFLGGFYVGLGAGAAFTKGEVSWNYFVSNSGTKTRTSFVGAAMLGYSHYLSERLVLDFRYRLSGFMGPKWSRGVTQEFRDTYGSTLEEISIKTGFILDNAFTVGLRFEF